MLQELIFSIILFRKGVREGTKSDLWLSFLVLLCAMYMTPWMLGKAGWYAAPTYREVLLFIPFHQYFLFGPVMYFFTRELTGERIDFDKNDWLHFLPSGLYLLYAVIMAVTDLLVLDTFYFYQDGMDKDFKPWYQITGLVSMIIYAFFSIRKYEQYKHHIYETVSFADSVRYRWLRDFLISLIVIIIFRGLFILIFPEMGDWGFKWWYYLIFAISSYYLGLSGLINSIKVSALEVIGHVSPSQVGKSQPGTPPAKLEHLYEEVNQLFLETRIFAQANLTLADVAKVVETNTSVLSKVINEKAGMNFNDYVNTFRVTAVKEAIQRGDMKHKTLVGIAMDHGFNSKSTFIRSFKKQEGKTPSEYYKSLPSL